MAEQALQNILNSVNMSFFDPSIITETLARLKSGRGLLATDI